MMDEILLRSVLSRYISLRFTRTLIFVFAATLGIIFVLDFVELMRRKGDAAGSSVLILAYMSLLRTPAVAEKVIPFAVLAASMIALVSLTRRLELVVARTAGVSAWQFLAPMAVAALIAGLFSILIYNPVSTSLRARADAIETKLTGRSLRAANDGGIWLRQRSVDGQSILRAEKTSNNATELAVITAFIYDNDGRFIERIEARRAVLTDGAWELKGARIKTPGQTLRLVESYLLATNLTKQQISQSFVRPDAVPFWELRSLARRTEAAGLNPGRYYLRFQELLARPLLLVAMVFISACFSLRFFRFGGITTAVSGGIVSGFVLYVATKLGADLGGAGLLSAPVAAWSPAAVGIMLGVVVLLHQEDG